jgi:mono/diheme cytochrome c family protein
MSAIFPWQGYRCRTAFLSRPDGSGKPSYSSNILVRLVIPLAALLVLTGFQPARAAEPPVSPQALEFFEKQVRPVLVENCQSCHGPKKQHGDLRLDSRAGILKGGETGPAIVVGEPDKSLLIAAVRQQGDLKMPPKTRLSAAAIDALANWIRQGAPWPETTDTAAKPATIAEVRGRHWAFQPVKNPAPPALKHPQGVRNPIDAFICQGLEARGLPPSPQANRRTLIRRATFDLIGLPPTPEEVTAFENDPDPAAYVHLIDRLLASPRYGERWGRHWLDVARYADSKGYVFTEERRYPYAYTYRDYVIRAFNEDLPYDQFIVHQLAADLLPLGEDKRPLAALGFLTLGRRFLNNPHDIIDDRIDVTMRGLQGMTVACARCHDHKFDPIPIRDYYSLYGVFASSHEPKDLPLLGAPAQTDAYHKFDAELKKREQVVAEYRQKHQKELDGKNRLFEDELRELQKKVDEWKVMGPGSPPRAMVLNDNPSPMMPHVFLRGNPGNRGEQVPRQFLEVVAGTQRKPFMQGSGRLELARAIANKDNPLTARVMVNRIWMLHFGNGLVRTPGDFGLRGEAPTHPELLDYLAHTFMDQGWSVKKLHRLIMLSATYQQSSEDNPSGRSADLDNRLLWKMNRRRLELEPLRDSLLNVAGRLDLTMGGPPVDIVTRPFSRRRTVYGFIDRQNLPGLFRTFDFASPDASTQQRHMTTVPQQALFLMNSPFVVEQARAFVKRADVTALAKDEARIDRLHRLAYGRPAEAEEIAFGMKFLKAVAEKPDKGGKLSAWEQYGQVLLLANEFAFVD